MWPNPQKTEDLVLFTEEILNGKLQFLCNTKIRLHVKMAYFNDPFLMTKKKQQKNKKKKRCMQTHYSLKKWSLKKVFHSKHGPWRRTCCYCRCVYIRKEETKKKTENTQYLGKTLAHAKRRPWDYPSFLIWERL